MNNFFDNLYGVLFQPVAAMRRINETKPLGQAITVFLVASVLSGLMGVFTLRTDQFPPGMVSAVGTFVFLLSVLLGIVMLFLNTAVFHLIAEFLGGRGKGYNLFITLAFAGLPGILVAPLGLLARLFPFNLQPLFTLLIAVWTIVLEVIAIREVHMFSTGRAVATLLIPVAVLVLVVIIFAVLFAATLMPLIMQSMPHFPGI